MSLNPIIRTWHRDGYTLSTDKTLLHHESISDAFDSDLMWWAKRPAAAHLDQMISHSLCFGLYVDPASAEASAQGDTTAQPASPMVGFARAITDYCTFAYLTDVYVLAEHQGRGLGRWMMDCLNEVVGEWPHLRHLMLMTGTQQAARMYKKSLGVVEWMDSPWAKEIVLLERPGKSAMEAMERFPEQ